jgi:hypothetical protein
MAQDMERNESITLIEEIFTALGTLDETFTFSGPIAYFPSGIREVAYKNAQNKWVDLNPKHYQLDIGGVSFSFIGSFSLPAGTQVRCLYTSPGGATVTIAGTVDVQQVIPDEPVSATFTIPDLLANAIGSGTVLNGVVVLADQDNTGDVFVGDSGVLTTNGYRLTAGESISVPASDISKIYVIGTVVGDKVHYIGG